MPGVATFLRVTWARLTGVFHHGTAETELAEELEAHRARLIDDGIRRGLPPEEAGRQADVALGSNLAIREAVRDEAGLPWLESAWRDGRYALRSLRKTPAFTTVAVLTLAMGIGANAAMFSVVNAVLLRPLPFYHPQRLVALSEFRVGESLLLGPTVSYPDFQDIRMRSRNLESVASYEQSPLTLTLGRESVPVAAETVSANLFRLLGVQPTLGRTFLQIEDTPGHDAIVLSDQFWHSHFNGDRAVLGQVLRLNGVEAPIVGVMPAGFQFPIRAQTTDVWVSYAREAEAQQGTPSSIERNNHHLEAIGRLAPDATLAQANAELVSIARGLAKEYPDTNSYTAIVARPELEYVAGDRRSPLLMLFAAVGLVLLIACANMANLLLARSTSRGREIALRLAIGATRSRVVRQLVTESLVLSFMGAALGIIVAYGAIAGVLRLYPNDLPRSQSVGIDASVLAFTVTVAALTGIVFGLVPALQTSRPNLAEAMQEGGRASTAGPRQSRLRAGLVISEAALGAMLVIAAALLLRSFERLSHSDPGFNVTHLFTAQWNTSAGPNDHDAEDRFLSELFPRLRALPGVTAAAGALPLPLYDDRWYTNFDLAERPLPKEKQPLTGFYLVMPGFFETMQIPLVSGRTFDEHDRRNSPPVLIVSKAFAEKFFPNENPIGQRITVVLSEGPKHGNYKMREVVGVVGDIRHSELQSAPPPSVYIPLPQLIYGMPSLLIRTAGDPLSVAADVRRALAATDPEAVLYGIRTMEDCVALDLGLSRFQAVLLSLFAGIALLLTAVGLYGVMAYAVGQRLHEIGVRRALGATTWQVFSLVMRSGLGLTATGVALGVFGALVLARFGQGLLYGISAHDPASYVVAAVALFTVGVVASYVPAFRATRVDPMVMLRAR